MNYRDRNEAIDAFLQYFAKLAKENPDLNFKSESMNNYVYRQLYHIGVKRSEFGIDLSDKPSPTFHGPIMNNGVGHPESSFNLWINSFRNRKTDVHVSAGWRYFCQFISQDKTANDSKQHLKVYVPLDAAHIERGATMIFDFLERNNISHVSKIGKAIRFDDIVIRLVEEKDVDTLINFINNTSYLMQGLISPNPFAYNKNGIALAVDGSLSYNSTVAGLISLYIDNKMRTKTLNNVGCEDFYAFVNDMLISEFVNNESTELTDYFQIYGEDVKRNYKQVFSLIMKVHDPMFSYEKLKGHYQECLREEKKLSPGQIANVERTLLEAIDLMIKRFNDEYAIHNVESYYLTGDPTKLTRNNNLRDRVVHSTFRRDLNAILELERKTFMQYAVEVMLKYGYNPSKAVDYNIPSQYR